MLALLDTLLRSNYRCGRMPDSRALYLTGRDRSAGA